MGNTNSSPSSVETVHFTTVLPSVETIIVGQYLQPYFDETVEKARSRLTQEQIAKLKEVLGDSPSREVADNRHKISKPLPESASDTAKAVLNFTMCNVPKVIEYLEKGGDPNLMIDDKSFGCKWMCKFYTGSWTCMNGRLNGVNYSRRICSADAINCMHHALLHGGKIGSEVVEDYNNGKCCKETKEFLDKVFSVIDKDELPSLRQVNTQHYEFKVSKVIKGDKELEGQVLHVKTKSQKKGGKFPIPQFINTMLFVNEKKELEFYGAPCMFDKPTEIPDIQIDDFEKFPIRLQHLHSSKAFFPSIVFSSQVKQLVESGSLVLDFKGGLKHLTGVKDNPIVVSEDELCLSFKFNCTTNEITEVNGTLWDAFSPDLKKKSPKLKQQTLSTFSLSFIGTTFQKPPLILRTRKLILQGDIVGVNKDFGFSLCFSVRQPTLLTKWEFRKFCGDPKCVNVYRSIDIELDIDNDEPSEVIEGIQDKLSITIGKHPVVSPKDSADDISSVPIIGELVGAFAAFGGGNSKKQRMIAADSEVILKYEPPQKLELIETIKMSDRERFVQELYLKKKSLYLAILKSRDCAFPVRSVRIGNVIYENWDGAMIMHSIKYDAPVRESTTHVAPIEPTTEPKKAKPPKPVEQKATTSPGLSNDITSLTLSLELLSMDVRASRDEVKALRVQQEKQKKEYDEQVKSIAIRETNTTQLLKSVQTMLKSHNTGLCTIL